MAGAGIYVKTPSGLVAAATVPGKQGSQGPQSSLVPGTITTGAAGSSAAATITGPGPVQTLNLTIPRGDPGGFTLSSLLTAGQSLDALVTPGLYYANVSALNTVSQGYPLESWGGHVEVIRIYDTGVLQRLTSASLVLNSLVAHASGIFVRAKYGTLWGPWRKQHIAGEIGGGDLTGTGSPLGVVPANPGVYYTDLARTNGALRWYKGSGTGNTGWECIIGDTGWRNLSADMLNGATPNGAGARIRRIGSVIYSQHAISFPTWVAGTAFLSVPSGFRGMANTDSYLPTALYGGGTESYILFGNGDLKRYATAASIVRMAWTWPTTDAWPTTLPGIAV